jgi:hypothetical protein
MSKVIRLREKGIELRDREIARAAKRVARALAPLSEEQRKELIEMMLCKLATEEKDKQP